MNPTASAIYVAIVGYVITTIELATGAESLPEALGRGIPYYAAALAVGVFAAWAGAQ